jgi:hypothetical protein
VKLKKFVVAQVVFAVCSALAALAWLTGSVAVSPVLNTPEITYFAPVAAVVGGYGAVRRWA